MNKRLSSWDGGVGVGVVEEVTKQVPLIAAYRQKTADQRCPTDPTDREELKV